MTAYYTKCEDRLSGPWSTYTSALHDKTREMWYGAPMEDLAVLLDVGSVNVADDELRELLHHDPLLRAVFELGRSHGYDAARRYAP